MEQKIELEMQLPEVEFEGPVGRFWAMKDVPFEALTKGAGEILGELQRRGYQERIVLESIKHHMP